MPGNIHDLDVCAACGHPIGTHAGGENCRRGGCTCPRFTPGRIDPDLPPREPRTSALSVVTERLAERTRELDSERLAARDRLWCQALIASEIGVDAVDAVLRKFEEFRLDKPVPPVVG